MSLDPIPCVLTGINKFSFWGAFLWNAVVFPSSSLWKTHEDTLDTSTSLQTEHGSTVVDKVELNVTSSSHELPLLLLLGELIILVLLNDWPVGLDDGIARLLGKFKNLVWITVVLVIKKNTSQTTRLATVRDQEIAVGPSLELLVVRRIVVVADFLVGTMEVLHVILIDVARSDIRSSTEPPDTTVRLKITVVKVHGRTEWVLWVHDRRKTAREKGHTFAWFHALGTINASLGGSLQGFLWHGPVDHRKVDTGLFKDIAARHYARHSSSAVGAGPAVLLEFGGAVNILNCRGNVELSGAQHFLHFGAHGVVAAVWAVLFADQTFRCFVN
mmetsp:Transcript_31047/g.51290  ORF Transcript_31047/g.51290 Transcript_31047/m.51290 type:complete len:329 (+) Transcript_31047:171-1157(+)